MARRYGQPRRVVVAVRPNPTVTHDVIRLQLPDHLSNVGDLQRRRFGPADVEIEHIDRTVLGHRLPHLLPLVINESLPARGITLPRKVGIVPAVERIPGKGRIVPIDVRGVQKMVEDIVDIPELLVRPCKAPGFVAANQAIKAPNGCGFRTSGLGTRQSRIGERVDNRDPPRFQRKNQIRAIHPILVRGKRKVSFRSSPWTSIPRWSG